MSSTRTLVTLLRPWIRRFTIIISAWWLRTSSKFTWEEVKTSTGKLGKWSTPKRVRIRPKHSAPSLSRDRRIKMHQSINHQSTLALTLICDYQLTQWYSQLLCLLFSNQRDSVKPPTCVVDRWAGGSLTQRPKGLFAVSWPMQLGEFPPAH